MHYRHVLMDPITGRQVACQIHVNDYQVDLFVERKDKDGEYDDLFATVECYDGKVRGLSYAPEKDEPVYVEEYEI